MDGRSNGSLLCAKLSKTPSFEYNLCSSGLTRKSRSYEMQLDQESRFAHGYGQYEKARIDNDNGSITLANTALVVRFRFASLQSDRSSCNRLQQ